MNYKRNPQHTIVFAESSAIFMYNNECRALEQIIRAPMIMMELYPKCYGIY